MLSLEMVNHEREDKAEDKEDHGPDGVIQRHRHVKHKQVRPFRDQTQIRKRRHRQCFIVIVGYVLACAAIPPAAAAVGTVGIVGLISGIFKTEGTPGHGRGR